MSEPLAPEPTATDVAAPEPVEARPRQAQGQPDVQAHQGPETQPGPASETEPEPASHLEPGPASETGPEPAAHTEPEPAAQTEPEPAAQPEPASDLEPHPASDLEPHPASDLEPHPASENAKLPPPGETEPEPASEVAEQPPAGQPEPEPASEAEPGPEPTSEMADVLAGTTEPEPDSAPTPQADPEATTAAEAAPQASPTAKPSSPVPSPALFARGAAIPAAAAFGRVDEAGVVYVRTVEGEREVGSYPGASSREALAYFARKYDELAASVELLHQRVTQTDIGSKEAAEAVARLREQVNEARVVGDLAALQDRLTAIDEAVVARRAMEAQQRAAAKAEAAAYREQIVMEAERIAAQPESSMQWKSSGARLRELLEEWKAHQRSGPRLDKDQQAQLWHRFSVARNTFDKARRTHFAQLDTAHAEAKATKERLVVEAERLAKSRDWAATAGAFKRLMDEWRRAGRASRGDDDLLWERFKAAQDAFFSAKDAVAAAEDENLRRNLTVKQELLAEAEALLPVTDLDQAKTTLRVIQDKWDRAGKVPRGDLERTERALRRVEQAVRDAEERRWSSSNPEAAARAQSLVEQLERAVADLEADLARAQASGNASKVAEAEAALQARQEWLAQARAGLREFGPRP